MSELDPPGRSDPPPPPTFLTGPYAGRSDSSPPPAFSTGPYAGRSLDEIALIDPDYLLDVVREGVGDVELRAEAARALATRDRIPPAQIARTLVQAAMRRIGPQRPPPRPWVAVLGLGVATILVLAFVGRASGLIDVLAALPARALSGMSETAISTTPVSVQEGSAISANGEVGSASSRSGAAGVGTGTGAGSGTGDDVASGTGAGNRVAGGSVMPGAGSIRDHPLDPAGLSRRQEAWPSTSESASMLDSPSSKASANGSAPPCGARIPGAIPAESVEDFVDTHQAVEFEVVGTKDTGRVTFLNSHDPYQDHFYVAIFPDDYASFPEPPALYFRGPRACVVVRGTIERYRGTPQIVLRDPDDLRVVPEP